MNKSNSTTALKVVKNAPHTFDVTIYESLEQRIPKVFMGYKKGDPLGHYFSLILEGIPQEVFDQKLGIMGLVRLAVAISKQTQNTITRKQAEKEIEKFYNGDSEEPWLRRSIFEKDGYTFVQERRSMKFLANFVLEPEYMIVRSADTGGGGKINENLYCFRMVVNNENFGSPQTSTIILRASDFDDLKSFQEATKTVGGRIITGSSAVVAEFGVHVLNKPFPVTKHGSNVFGMDTIDGRKYFVTPHTVYDVETGNEVNDIVFMPEHDSNPAVDFKLDNLKYDPIKWREQIAPFFLRHIMRIHKKDIMLLIVGWLTTIPVEYVFRKLSGEMAGFPHAMITGMNGGGKTVLVTSLLPYLGYSKDADLLNFGGKVANIQSVDWSYNIVVIFDEYRPNEWAEGERKGVERLIREAYGRSEDRKSNTSYNVRKFVRKNPMMMLGQMTTSDDANSERIIQMYLDPNFMNKDSKEAQEAKKYSRAFQSYDDPNFWVGFCLWMARQPHEELLKIYHEFKAEVVELFPDMKDRLRCFCAVVMTGLHFFERLAEELGVSMEEVGYNASDIMLIPSLMADNREVTQGETANLLEQFLDDLVTLGLTYGNSNASIFGKDRAVQIYKTYLKNKHTWGKHNEPAIINGREEVVLIKMDTVIGIINDRMKRNYDDKLLNPVLKSYYDAGMENPDDALVLAPNGYRVNGIRYAVFDLKKLLERGLGKIRELRPQK